MTKAIYTITQEFCPVRNRLIWVTRKNGEWFGKIEPLSKSAAESLIEEDKFFDRQLAKVSA